MSRLPVPPFGTILLLLVSAILQIERLGVSASANDSYCINYRNTVTQTTLATIPYDEATRSHGTVDCQDGDVVLIGNYINLGERYFLSHSMPG